MQSHILEEAQKVLDFWFGLLISKTDITEKKSLMWFVNGANYDDIIRVKFKSLHKQASEGQLKYWENSPKNLLAHIILLDQFSRHIYRNSAKSFAQDRQAIQLVCEGIDAGHDQKLFFVERQFFYMPLMHAENLDMQNLSVKMFARLRDEVPDELKELYSRTLSFAESHHFVISKFGRFPELNKILGRESTDAEMEFLSTGKYQFL